MRKRPLLQMILLGVVAAAILIAIALVIPWFPSDASKQAHNVHTLYDVLLIVSIPIFVLVETVVVFSVWKFRMRPGQENKDGPPIHGNTRLEVVWTALPAILLISLCSYAYAVLRSNESNKKNAMTVNVTARQFAFEFSYAAPGGKTVVSPILYLPKGQPVVFKLRSLDVIHSFFVPDFSEKLDAVPGITTTLRVTPSRLGTYPVECTELCGAGHSLMRSTVYVMTPTAFQQWLAAQPANAAPPVGIPPANASQAGVPGAAPTSPAAPPEGGPSKTGSPTGGGSSASAIAAGKALFTSETCSGCHTLAAAGATGTVGPNLDQRLRTDCASPASMRVRGASLQQCVTTAITKPYAFIPSGFSAGIMPPNFAQTLSPAQIQQLVTFLTTVAK